MTTTNISLFPCLCRRLARPLGLALAAWALGSCNSQVFIDDFLPHPPSVAVAEAGERVVIPFEADNWSFRRVDYLLNDIQTYSYDSEGNFRYLPFDEGQRGTLRLNGDYFDLQVERTQPRELEVLLKENLYDNPVELTIVVGNAYEEKDLRLSVSPTAKYRVDSVAYDWTLFRSSTDVVEAVESFVVDNSRSSDTFRLTVYPYESVKRRISLFNLGTAQGEEHYARLFGRPLPRITIPDLADGHPLLRGTQISFGLPNQELEAGLDPGFAAEVAVEGGKCQRIQVFVAQEYYEVPYTLYASHPQSGQTRTFCGSLTSKRPVAAYYITRTDLITDDTHE